MKLKTKRLTLSLLTINDLSSLVSNYELSVPQLSKAYEEMLINCKGFPAEFMWYSCWRICILGTDKEIGFAGFKGFNGGSPEIGYGIDEEYQGAGYASEAVNALCRWAFGMPRVKSIQAETEPDNAASQRVLAKNGFEKTGVMGAEGPRFLLQADRLSPESDITDAELDNTVAFRFACREDCGLILQFIKELASYEKMSKLVVADEKALEEWIFDKQKAEVLFALMDGKEVGFALFFHNFSTFLGRAGIYLEDLFVLDKYRGRGCGTAIMRKLASIALERGCGRLEWWCLDWNKPSIDFYISLGAKPMSDWTVYRMEGDSLRRLVSLSD